MTPQPAALVALHDTAAAAGAAEAAESASWAQFAGARDESAFLAGWLAIACTQIRHSRGALLLLRQGAESRFGAAAVWPDPQRDLQHLAPAAERTLKERRGLVVTPPTERAGGAAAAHVGYPIELDGALHGAVVLELPLLPPAELQRALRLLHWASAWLVERLRARAQAAEAARAERATRVGDWLATVLQAPTASAGALALADALAAALHCERASVGLVRGNAVELLAISHTAHFDARSALARQLAEAMDEALDLGVPLQFPAPPDDDLGATAQAALALQAQRSAVCTVPLVDGGRTVGALTLERGPAGTAGQAFDEATVATLRALATLLGPLLVLRQREARGAVRRLADGLRGGWDAVVRPGHPGARLMALLAAAVVAAALVQVPYRVPAHAVVEGELRRAAIAPFDGVLAEALVRPGDTVRQGQPLARLADRELQLERSRWSSERALADQRLRQAAAQGDRAAMAIAQAQRQQAEAQLGLIEERLAHATVTAPIDALVAEGDLSLQVGGPVQQGKLLFELVPLAQFRLALDVDERDVARVAGGQGGRMVAAGLPDRELPFVVERVTPLAAAQDGHNGFRVEARLALPDAERATLSRSLRPGLEGAAKIDTGDAPLWRVSAQRLIDALRLALWRFLP